MKLDKHQSVTVVKHAYSQSTIVLFWFAFQDEMSVFVPVFWEIVFFQKCNLYSSGTCLCFFFSCILGHHDLHSEATCGLKNMVYLKKRHRFLSFFKNSIIVTKRPLVTIKLAWKTIGESWLRNLIEVKCLLSEVQIPVYLCAPTCLPTASSSCPPLSYTSLPVPAGPLL